jgi:hypothetical protein
MMGCNPEANISTHRMADKVSLFDTYRLHPQHDAGSYLVKGKSLAVTPHCSEAWQVYQVEPIVFRQGGYVAYPPSRGAGQPMDQYDRFSLTHNLVIDCLMPYLNLMPGDVNTCLPFRQFTSWHSSNSKN